MKVIIKYLLYFLVMGCWSINGNADDKLFYYMKNQFVRHGFTSLGNMTKFKEENKWEILEIHKATRREILNASLDDNILSINSYLFVERNNVCNKLDKYVICWYTLYTRREWAGFVKILLNKQEKLLLKKVVTSLLFLKQHAMAFTSNSNGVSNIGLSSGEVYEINLKSERSYYKKLLDWSVAITKAMILDEEKGEYLFTTIKGELVKLIYRPNEKAHSKLLMRLKGWIGGWPTSMIKLNNNIILLTLNHSYIVLIDLNKNITEVMIPNESMASVGRIKFQIVLPNQK